MTINWTTPAPSSSFVEGLSFKVGLKRTASLQFSYEDSDDLIRRCELKFIGIESFKCTYMTSLSVEMINSAYDRLIEIPDSPWIKELKARTEKPLKHFRICFDDGPCYEFICADVEISIAEV